MNYVINDILSPTHAYLVCGHNYKLYEFLESHMTISWDMMVSWKIKAWLCSIGRVMVTEPRSGPWHASSFPTRARSTAIRMFGRHLIESFPHHLRGCEMQELLSSPEMIEDGFKLSSSGIIGYWFGLTTSHTHTDTQPYRERFDVAVDVLVRNENIQAISLGLDPVWPCEHMTRVVHPLQSTQRTPLLHFLTGAWINSCSQAQTSSAATAMKIVDQRLGQWLSIIESAGCDLDEYGRNEGRLLRNGSIPKIRWQRVAWRDVYDEEYGWYGGLGIYDARLKTICFTAPKLVGITYGPSVEDWELVWDMDVEEVTGEFWHMLNRTQYHVPGSWDPDWEQEDEMEDEWSDHGWWRHEEDAWYNQGAAFVPVRVR